MQAGLNVRWHPAWVGVVGVLVYLPTAWFGLIDYDDPWVIRDNAVLHVLSLESLWHVFLDFSFEQRLRLGGEYLPIRDLSVMIDYALYGDWFGGHHLTNALLYGLGCAMAASMVDAWTSSRPLAWLSGLMFAVHPVHVESAAWLSERKGVLGAALVFGSLWAFRRFQEKKSMRVFVGTCALLWLAIWSRSLAVVTVAAAAALTIWYPTRSMTKRGQLASLAFYAIVGLVAFIPGLMASQASGLVQPFHGEGLFNTLRFSAHVHGKYIGLLALAGPYAVEYPVVEDPHALLFTSLGTAGAIAGTLTCLVALARPSWRNAGTFGIAWWLIYFFPVSHLGAAIQNEIADRYLLLPSFGLLLTLSALVLKLERRVALVVATAWLSASLLWTLPQVQVWSSTRALREHMIQVFPRNPDSWENLARVSQAEGDYESAWRIAEVGLELAPRNWRLLHREGLILEQMGRPRAAIQKMREAAQQGPEAHKAQANLALMLLRAGQKDEALKWATSAALAQPQTPHNQRVLGMVALELGQTALACAAFERATRLQPYSADNHFNQGLCALQARELEKSKIHFERAVALDPALKARIDALPIEPSDGATGR